MLRLTFLNIVAGTLMQIYLWYFVNSDSLYVYKKAYIIMTMLFTVILHKLGRHIEERDNKMCGPV
jgi:hypothetical protein